MKDEKAQEHEYKMLLECNVKIINDFAAKEHCETRDVKRLFRSTFGFDRLEDENTKDFPTEQSNVFIDTFNKAAGIENKKKIVKKFMEFCYKEAITKNKDQFGGLDISRFTPKDTKHQKIMRRIERLQDMAKASLKKLRSSVPARPRARSDSLDLS